MKYVKGAILFSSGLLTGFGIGYIYMKKVYDTKKQEEIERIRKHYEEKTNKIEVKKEAKKKKDKKKYDKILEEKGYVPYHEMSEKEVRNRVKTVSDNSLITEAPTEGYPDEPIVISEEEYSEKELYFEKLEYDYYLDDGALVDPNDELQSIDATIGYDILEKFLANDNENVIYVRNAGYAQDYEITKVGGSYSSIVGIGGDEDE